VFAVEVPAEPALPPTAAMGTQSATAQIHTVDFSAGDPLAAKDKYKVAVGSLFREGSLLVLRMTIGCVHSTGSLGTCDANYNLAGIYTVPPLPPLSPGRQQFDLSAYWTVSGFCLRDPVTGTDYIPLHTAYETPLVASITEDPHVGNTYSAWVYYPLPPRSVISLTVVMPGGNVRLAAAPISSSPPAAP
jgi:hypothetical protein